MNQLLGDKIFEGAPSSKLSEISLRNAIFLYFPCSRFFSLRLFHADLHRSFKFGELTTVNDARCRDAGTRPGAKGERHVHFTFFPQFYDVAVRCKNRYRELVCTREGGQVSRTETFSESLLPSFPPAYRQISKIFTSNIVIFSYVLHFYLILYTRLPESFLPSFLAASFFSCNNYPLFPI